MAIFRTLFSLSFVLGISTTLYADHHLKPINVAGVWNVTASTDNGERSLVWKFVKKDNKLSGTSVDEENGRERDFDRITIKEKSVTVEMDMEQDGRKGVIRVEAKAATASKLIGKWSIVGDDDTVYMSGELTALKEVGLAGMWEATSELQDGNTFETVLDLKGKNSSLKGTFESDFGETKIDKITAKDDAIRFTFDLEMNGTFLDCVIEATPDGDDKLIGKWIVMRDDGTEAAQGKWSAVRRFDIAGEWQIVAIVPNAADYNASLTLKMKDSKYSGMSKNADGEERELTSVKFDGKTLEYSMEIDSGEYTGTITVVAKRTDDGGLDGEWAFTDDGGTELARESWKATRK